MPKKKRGKSLTLVNLELKQLKISSITPGNKRTTKLRTKSFCKLEREIQGFWIRKTLRQLSDNASLGCVSNKAGHDKEMGILCFFWLQNVHETCFRLYEVFCSPLICVWQEIGNQLWWLHILFIFIVPSMRLKLPSCLWTATRIKPLWKPDEWTRSSVSSKHILQY